ncbi:hypothetical protein DFJ74DRAFT_658284 [Hyaloraphidium curvatum]|nr:hypothetical protein DFJ74DRAFT_658284 [Hyaloraphidium curvatum]
MQFVPLRELQPCPSATFYAVVAAAKEPTKSKGTDYVLSFQLTDPTVENTFVSVQIFRRTLAELPSVQVGDVVKLSNVKVQRFNGKAQCLSTRQTACLAFPSDRKDLVARPPPDNSPEGAAEVDQEQDERPIAALRRWWRKSRERVEPAAMILPSARRPTLRQSELEANRFFDYYGEVLATRSITDTQCLVWLTDFTASPLLRPYEPEGLIPEYEPVCQGSVLPCIAWDANAVRAAGLVAGQIALFRNMLARDRDGFLEAHLHGDREGTATENRIRVIDIEDSSLLEFLEQRASVVSVPPRRISMCQPSQKRRISEAFDTEGEGSEASPSARRSKALSARTSLASAQSATPRTNRSRSIAEILMDNQVPNRYFCDAKVLDYLPRRTKDFAVPICDRCHARQDRRCCWQAWELTRWNPLQLPSFGLSRMPLLPRQHSFQLRVPFLAASG